MEKIFLIILNFFVLIVACFSKAIPKESIPNLVLAERSCDYETKPDLGKILEEHNTCNVTTPAIITENYLEMRHPAACFAFYDAIFRLCEISNSPTEAINTNPYQINSTNVCTVANTTLDKIKYEYKDKKTAKWFNLFKSIVYNKEECEELCIYKTTVASICEITITSLKLTFEEEPKQSSKETNVHITPQERPETPLEDIKKPSKDKEISKNNLAEETIVTPEGNKNVESDRVVSKPVTEEHPLDKIKTVAMYNPLVKDVPNLEDNPNFDQQEDTKQAKIVADVEEEAKQAEAQDDSNLPDDDVNTPKEDKEILQEQPIPKIPEMEISTGISDRFVDAEDSNFFTYFAMMTGACIFAYVFFHNKNKILALALEGRKVRSSRGKGRHSSTSYSRLHSNLGEAIASDTTTPTSTHVLF